MQTTRPTLEPIITPDPEGSGNKTVVLDLGGRLMCADFNEYQCVAVEMSPFEAYFRCAARPQNQERIIAYVDHIGRVEGNVSGLTEDGFRIRIKATERKRQKLAAQLNWFANRNSMGVVEDRRHERIVPRDPNAEIKLADGDTYPCRIVDLSMSGAAIEIEARPALGSHVVLGNMRGRVVRHFDDGIAIEFATIQSPEALENYI